MRVDGAERVVLGGDGHLAQRVEERRLACTDMRACNASLAQWCIPTFGIPTMPIFKLFDGRPSSNLGSGSPPFFLLILGFPLENDAANTAQTVRGGWLTG